MAVCGPSWVILTREKIVAFKCGPMWEPALDVRSTFISSNNQTIKK